MTVTLTTTAADIAGFAAEVRRHLDDLPADEVDDLLDGLEADLSEQAADAGETFEIPDAAAYAAELRAAAGLPERREPEAARVPMHVRMEELRAQVAGRIRSHRAGRAALDFLTALRPVWWVLRGAALYVVLAFFPSVIVRESAPVPRDPFAWLVLLLAVVLSVQWGRGLWLPTRWLRVLRTIVNVVTAVAAVIMLISAPTVLPRAFAPTAIAAESSPLGLSLDGEPVNNIFPYDSEGNPLTGVQLFDEQGRPLTTVGADGVENAWQWDHVFRNGTVTSPAAGTGTRPVWNVFPLRETQAGGVWVEDPRAGVSEADPGVPPFPQVPRIPLLTDPSPSPVATPSPAESPAP